MTPPILIDTGPSDRGWHAKVKRQLEEMVASGRIEVQELHAHLIHLVTVWAPPPSNACRLPLTQGKYALVDAEDFDWLAAHEWCATLSKRGKWVVMRTGIKGPTGLLHRAIMKPPKDVIIDHINGDTFDNRKCNLRFANHSQNGANSAISKNNTTGFKGVSIDKRRTHHTKPWFACIRVNYKTIHLGRYATKEEAAKAYDEAARRYFGEFARLNFAEEAS